VDIEYHKFYESERETEAFQPYHIKQFSSRWHIIGIKVETNNIRTYALDRIIKIETKKNKFAHNKEIDLVSYLKNSFGIIAPNVKEP
jgi:predicted DNA-binding transcriptional regulator YafY